MNNISHSLEGMSKKSKTVSALDAAVADQWPNVDKGMTVVFAGKFGMMSSLDKIEHPYTYKPFLMWGNKDKDARYITDYSDRLYQQDWKKYNKCCQEVFGNQGQYFDERDPKLTEKFLCLFYEKQVKLCWIEEHCNVSNGYPLWLFGCRDIK
jgi:hypothetical protein